MGREERKAEMYSHTGFIDTAANVGNLSEEMNGCWIQEAARLNRVVEPSE